MVDFEQLFDPPATGAAPPLVSPPPAASTTLPATVPHALPSLGSSMVRGVIPGMRIAPERLGLMPPRLTLCHKKERRDQREEPGQWKLGKFIFDELTAVFPLIHDGRTFSLGTGKETHIACASTDGEVPHKSIVKPYSEYCRSCSNAEWRTLADGKRKPPKCKPFAAFLGVCLEGVRHATPGQPEGERINGECRPFWYIAQKTAEKSAREFCQAMQKGFEEEGVRHLAQYVTRIASAPQTGEGGVTWYVPTFTIIRRAEPEEFGQLRQEAEGLIYVPRIRQSETATPVASGGNDSELDESDIPF